MTDSKHTIPCRNVRNPLCGSAAFIRRGAFAVLLLVGAFAISGLTGPSAAIAGQARVQACTAKGNPAKPQSSDSSALHELVSEGRERSYILRLPKGYSKRDSWPVILAFHGRGSTGPEVEGYSELSRLPAIVVYPNGEFGTGSGNRRAWQGAPYQPPGLDDVAFIAALLDTLARQYCIDGRRIYATGKSNGGGFAALLGCRLRDRIAAIAPVAGAFYPQSQPDCERAVPFLGVHGTGDVTIPFAGDKDRQLPEVLKLWSIRAERAECDPAPSQIERADLTIYRWRGCRSGGEVRGIAVTGGGHTWPGSDIYSGGGRTTQSIETARVIWRFFRRHKLDDTRADRGNVR